MRGIWLLTLVVLALAGCNKEEGLSFEEQMAQDVQTIDDFLEENNVQNVIVHSSGIRYVIHEDGAGPLPKPGNFVKVDYTGRLLTGEMFDTCIEADAIAGDLFDPNRIYAPIKFTLGVGQVIQGWDIGIGLLKEKTKATLYIPSPLAYGSNPRDGSIIPANGILEFYVDLIEVLN